MNGRHRRTVRRGPARRLLPVVWPSIGLFALATALLVGGGLAAGRTRRGPVRARPPAPRTVAHRAGASAAGTRRTAPSEPTDAVERDDALLRLRQRVAAQAPDGLDVRGPALSLIG